MMRPFTIIAVMILSLSAFGLFQIKYYVQNLHKDLAELSRQLEQEKESLHVLRAEWSYITQPERLRKLSNKYLNLQAIKTTQMLKLNNGLPIYLAENSNRNTPKIKSETHDFAAINHEEENIKKVNDIETTNKRKTAKKKNYANNNSEENLNTILGELKGEEPLANLERELNSKLYHKTKFKK